MWIICLWVVNVSYVLGAALFHDLCICEIAGQLPLCWIPFCQIFLLSLCNDALCYGLLIGPACSENKGTVMPLSNCCWDSQLAVVYQEMYQTASSDISAWFCISDSYLNYIMLVIWGFVELVESFLIREINGRKNFYHVMQLTCSWFFFSCCFAHKTLCGHRQVICFLMVEQCHLHCVNSCVKWVN